MSNKQLLKQVKRIIPPLSGELHKGQAGARNPRLAATHFTIQRFGADSLRKRLTTMTTRPRRSHGRVERLYRSAVL
jgi:hypothetical protein